MHNNTEALGKENITRLIFQYSLPATVGMVVAATYNIADTIFTGRLGSEAIAALSIAFIITIVMITRELRKHGIPLLKHGLRGKNKAA